MEGIPLLSYQQPSTRLYPKTRPTNKNKKIISIQDLTKYPLGSFKYLVQDTVTTTFEYPIDDDDNSIDLFPAIPMSSMLLILVLDYLDTNDKWSFLSARKTLHRWRQSLKLEKSPISYYQVDGSMLYRSILKSKLAPPSYKIGYHRESHMCANVCNKSQDRSIFQSPIEYYRDRVLKDGNEFSSTEDYESALPNANLYMRRDEEILSMRNGGRSIVLKVLNFLLLISLPVAFVISSTAFVVLMIILFFFFLKPYYLVLVCCTAVLIAVVCVRSCRRDGIS